MLSATWPSASAINKIYQLPAAVAAGIVSTSLRADVVLIAREATASVAR
jgi:hypothetical protein